MKSRRNVILSICVVLCCIVLLQLAYQFVLYRRIDDHVEQLEKQAVMISELSAIDSVAKVLLPIEREDSLIVFQYLKEKGGAVITYERLDSLRRESNNKAEVYESVLKMIQKQYGIRYRVENINDSTFQIITWRD